MASMTLLIQDNPDGATVCPECDHTTEFVANHILLSRHDLCPGCAVEETIDLVNGGHDDSPEQAFILFRGICDKDLPYKLKADLDKWYGAMKI